MGLAVPGEPNGQRGRPGRPTLVRLRALDDSGVEVPDLADTLGPVSERNCIGAITPVGEQREENDQAVTRWPEGPPGELDSAGGAGEPAREG